MSEFFFECKRVKLTKSLKRLGFFIVHGSKHDMVKCKSNGGKTTIPRHNKIKREIVESISKFVLDKGIDKILFLKSLK